MIDQNRAIFEADGPQLNDPGYGPEPTLEEMVQDYYQRHLGITIDEAAVYRERYIRGWLERHCWPDAEKPRS